MKLLIHLANIIGWYLIPCGITLVFSFLFDFSYWNAVHADAFAVLYAFYSIFITVGYLISTSEVDEPMSFIKTL